MCIFVRDLTMAEGRHLQKLLRRANTNVITARRAEIVLASKQGMKVPQIAQTYYCSEDHVRDVIHRFNADGLESLKPRYGGGRPPTFTPEQRSALVELSLTPPQFAGFPWTSWSLSKLQEAAVKRKIVKTISLETIRQVLDEAGVSYQRTKTWKESNDPEFEAKKRIKALYETPPTDGRVICVDEFGPLEIRPQLGQNWCRRKKPDRVPATYRRPHGVRYLFGAYDVQADLLYGQIKRRKRVVDFLGFLKALRRWYPKGRLYLVLDNLNIHRNQLVKAWAEENDMVLVYTPTYASWLNRIECHFRPLRKFAIENANYPDHKSQNRSIQRYLRLKVMRSPRQRRLTSLRSPEGRIKPWSDGRRLRVQLFP